MALRIVFFGTPAFAVPVLTEVVGQGHEVVAVYTRPPRAAGRGMAERKSPVHTTAERFALPVLTPPSLKPPDEAMRFAAFRADVAVVVAYGLLLPQAVLAAPAHGCLNLHASLLPRWRGAAPVARAIMAGDTRTGVMVMRMDEGLDTGPVAMSEEVGIGDDETAGELSGRLSRLGADLMVRALAAIAQGGLSFVPQAQAGATYARKIDKAETRIDWTRPAREVHNHIRGLSPEPGAWFEADLGKGPERVKALRSVVVSPGPSHRLPLPGGERASSLGEAKPSLETKGEGGRTVQERAEPPHPDRLADATRSDLSPPGRGGHGRVLPGTVLGDELTIACGTGAVRLLSVQRSGRQAVKADEFLRGLRTPLARVA